MKTLKRALGLTVVTLLSAAIMTGDLQAAVSKLSQIVDGGAYDASTDKLIAVRSGTTDVQVSGGGGGTVSIATPPLNLTSTATTNDTVYLSYAGSLIGGAGSLTLDGDNNSPGASQYYGTDGSANKGWYSLPTTGNISGSGSPYQVAVFNGSDTIGNSGINTDGMGTFVDNNSSEISLNINSRQLYGISGQFIMDYTGNQNGFAYLSFNSNSSAIFSAPIGSSSTGFYTIDSNSSQLLDSGVVIFDWANILANDAQGLLSIQFNGRGIYGSNGTQHIDYTGNGPNSGADLSFGTSDDAYFRGPLTVAGTFDASSYTVSGTAGLTTTENIDCVTPGNLASITITSGLITATTHC